MATEIVLPLRAIEAQLLTNLVKELVMLVDAPPAPDDPFDALVSQLQAPRIDRSDPAIQRLFPPAYANHDDDAEYHRLTEVQLRQARDTEAHVVLGYLDGPGGQALRVAIARDDAEAWLRTLNALRLTLAVRLEIDGENDAIRFGELPEDDPRFALYQIYEWLAYLLEVVLEQL